MLLINTIETNNRGYNGYKNSKFHRQQFNPAFGYRLPKFPVNSIRYIHKLKCGCCGNEMLTKEEVNHLLKSFAANSKRALEHPVITEKYGDTNAYAFLSELSQIQPRKTIRELISIPENAIKIKTLPQGTQLGINYIALLSDGITVKAPRVMQKLNKFYDFLPSDDKEVLDLMNIYAIKYPKKTFSEIFNLPEVAQYHKSIYDNFKEQILIQKSSALKDLREVFTTLPPKDYSALQEANTSAVKLLNNTYYEPHIKKILIKNIYEDFLREHPQSRKIRKQIKTVISSFPYKTSSPDGFIVNCIQSRKSDLDIVKKFVESRQLTFEHVLPKSQKGVDDNSNGIFLCKKCNHERSDIPYPVFLQFHPEMKINLQKQLNKIMTFIKNGKLIDYETYPLEIKQTIWEKTDNTIKLKIDKYLKFREKQAEKELKKAQESFNKKNKYLEQISGNLEQINEKIEETMSILRKLKKTKRGIKEEHEKASEQQFHSQKELEENNAKFNDARKITEYDKTMNKNKRAKRIKKLKDN